MTYKGVVSASSYPTLRVSTFDDNFIDLMHHPVVLATVRDVKQSLSQHWGWDGQQTTVLYDGAVLEDVDSVTHLTRIYALPIRWLPHSQSNSWSDHQISHKHHWVRQAECV